MPKTPKTVIGRDVTAQALKSPKVRAELRKRRDVVLDKAFRIAMAGGHTKFALALRAEDGTRPGTKSSSGIRRPYSRVIAGSADATSLEYGDVGVNRQAILRRAAGGR